MGLEALLDERLELDDHRLVERAARTIGVPRAEVEGDKFSFVLHAPLELLARAALLPYVEPSRREAARLRIAALEAGYDESGPPADPAPALEFDTALDAAMALTAAIGAGDLDVADAAATWMGVHVDTDRLVELLAATALDSLSAAGHANIYLALLARTQPRGLPGQMLRHPVRALAIEPGRSITMPEGFVEAPGHEGTRRLLDTLCDLPIVGPPSTFGVAAIVAHAEEYQVLDLLVSDGAFEIPAETPVALQRVAAQTMLQGPSDQAPYVWTHCLTLSQAPLLLATAGADEAVCAYVAAAYVAAFWASHGEGRLELDHVPGDGDGADLADALVESPRAAAATAWHEPDTSHTASILATSASVHHDAHRVKYTLACLDAAATDPPAAQLHLAAAAYLNAWWHQHPDPTDPLPQLSSRSD